MLFGFDRPTERMDYQEEMNFVREDNDYLRFMAKFVNSLKNGNTICLHISLDYGNRFVRELKRINPKKKVYIINGSISAKEREEIRQALETETGAVLVGTYKTISTGFSVKNLHYGCLLETLKSRTKVIQTIGRMLRLHNSKDKAKVYAFVPVIRYTEDTAERHYYGFLFNHHNKRIGYYRAESLEHDTIVVERDLWKINRNNNNNSKEE
jgi:superfamily II DNA or RNA helicase